MNCEQARELIDLRVQEAAEASAGQRDWSELDAHLAKCPTCSADLLELMRTRELLAGVAGDGPTDEETTKMWQAIEQSLPAGALVMQMPSVAKSVGRFLAACAGIAAVLTIALMVGRERYEAGPASVKLAEVTVDSAKYSLDVTADHAPAVASGTPSSEGARAAKPRRTNKARKEPAPRERESRDEIESPGDVGGGPFAISSAPIAGMGNYTDAFLSDSADVGEVSPGDQAPLSVPPPAVRPPSPPALSEAPWHVVDATGPYARNTPPPTSEVRTFNLQYADPTEVRELLKKVVEASGGHIPSGIATGEGESAPEPQSVAVEGSNSLIIQTSPQDTEVIKDLIRQLDAPVASGAGPTPGSTKTPEETRVRPKIIKSGELVIEVPVYDQAAAQVEQIVGEHGGFVADVTVREQAGGALQGNLVVRVPPERFEALFAALKGVGRVESENVKAADVTAQYVDLEARICGLQITEERLQELIQSKSFIDKIESLLEVEREMGRVRSEIEQLQGQLRVMADRVALSTMAVTLREPARTVPSASLSVEVATVADAADSLGETLAKLGGRLMSGKTSKRTDGTLQGDYKVQVSLARFGEMLAAIEALGRIEARQVTDRQFDDATKPWAEKVDCQLALVLYERSQQPPRGAVSIEVADLAAARKQLDELLAPCEAAVMSSETSRRDDGSNVGELRVRVPAGRFAELVDSLGPLGRTLAKETAGATGKIVGGAANVASEFKLTLAEPARQVPRGSMAIEVGTFETARGQLSTLVAEKGVQVLGSSSRQRADGTWSGSFRLGIKAGDMDAVVDRLESFGRVTSREITGIGLGDLSRSDPDALGVIELVLAEKAAITPEPDRAGNSIRSRLRDGFAGFYDSVGLIAYGLMAMAPWIVIVVLAAWVSLRLYRRRRPVPKPVTTTPPAED